MQASTTVFAVADIAASLAYYRGEVPRAPADQDYGMRTFDVADLDGNVLFFGMEIPKN